jgi:hypothetical protein
LFWPSIPLLDLVLRLVDKFSERGAVCCEAEAEEFVAAFGKETPCDPCAACDQGQEDKQEGNSPKPPILERLGRLAKL